MLATGVPCLGCGMDFRYLGNSGLQDLRDHLRQLAHPRLAGRERRRRRSACGRPSTRASRTFDTADVYANTRAETVLGEALKGERRESLEIFTKVYWPTGPGGQQRHRPVPQAHHGVDQRLAEPAADRLRRPLPGAPLRLRDAARGDDAGVRRRRPAGQGALHRRQRVDRRPDPRRRTRWPRSSASS